MDFLSSVDFLILNLASLMSKMLRVSYRLVFALPQNKEKRISSSKNLIMISKKTKLP